ncbi:MAG: HPF/RaiA family ribosome-associated protein [Gemmatimonadota bacterium]|nr:HPF/RaiA family ribosome-associated protein [Gemmatimonadota bacterium]
MLVQINTDSNIDATDALDQRLEGIVGEALDRFGEQLTRVEVHLNDENSNAKGGDADIRCLIEARLGGRPPSVVTHHAANVEQATEGAARKMRDKLDSVLGRLERR